MLAKRIIPCLDVEKGRVVKGTKFLELVDAGDPVAVAARYEAEGADELVFLDITASHEGRSIMLDMVRQVAETIFMPFTVGGGIRTLADAAELVQAGAEKVSINSAAVRTPELITAVADRLGSCATVVNIDPKRVERDGREVWEVFINGGRVPTGLDAVAWARRVEQLGAGEIVLTCMDRRHPQRLRPGDDLRGQSGSLDSRRCQRWRGLPGRPRRRGRQRPRYGDGGCGTGRWHLPLRAVYDPGGEATVCPAGDRGAASRGRAFAWPCF